jgi:hypothetical protein
VTNKVYKSAQGKPVDIGALILKNEGERAVGNMNVNARGDIIDPLNSPVSKRADQMRKHYSKQTNVKSDPVTVQKSKEKPNQ